MIGVVYRFFKIISSIFLVSIGVVTLISLPSIGDNKIDRAITEFIIFAQFLAVFMLWADVP